MKNDLTIVIPCKNEAGYIEHTLDSLNKQIGIDGVDVIVAYAQSTDDTLEIIKAFRKNEKTRFNLYIINGGSVAYGRNMGSKFIKKKHLIFIDADVTLPNKMTLWMTYSLLEGSEDGSLPKYDLVTCNFQSRSESLISKITFKLFNYVRTNFMKEPFAVGGYFATSRDAFERHGRFDETLMHTEDFVLSRKYDPEKFAIIQSLTATQDDRRFKKMGYLSFLYMAILNYINRNNIGHFRKDIKYWS